MPVGCVCDRFQKEEPLRGSSDAQTGAAMGSSGNAHCLMWRLGNRHHQRCVVTFWESCFCGRCGDLHRKRLCFLLLPRRSKDLRRPCNTPEILSLAKHRWGSKRGVGSKNPAVVLEPGQPSQISREQRFLEPWRALQLTPLLPPPFGASLISLIAKCNAVSSLGSCVSWIVAS